WTRRRNAADFDLSRRRLVVVEEAARRLGGRRGGHAARFGVRAVAVLLGRLFGLFAFSAGLTGRHTVGHLALFSHLPPFISSKMPPVTVESAASDDRRTSRSPLTPRVFALYISPVKGARGIPLERSDVLASGLRHDRRFMALDAHGTFVTQREHPRMALVETAIEERHLLLSIRGTTHRGGGPLDSEALAHRPRRHATVGKGEVIALDVGAAGAELLSDHLR